MTVKEILQTLILASTEFPFPKHEVDPARLRPSDVTLQIPDTSKFRQASGWEPTISARETLKNLLDWHREQVSLFRQ